MNSRFPVNFWLAVLASFWMIFTASAQPSQAFVSAQNGVDGNPCTLALPCRSLASAHSVVAAGGRILIVDSGDYAEVTITKSVTIEAAPGVAAVLKNPGLSTLVGIAAGNTDKVFLQGLHLKGSSSTNLRGILHSTGAMVSISHCVVEGFAAEAIRMTAANGHLTLAQTTVRNNATGINFASAASGVQTATIESSFVEKNTMNGINASSAANATLRLTLRDTTMVHNTGAGLRAIANPTNSNVECLIENSTYFGNGTGLHAERVGTVIRVATSTIVGNTTGLHITNSAQIFSRGNNSLEGNTTNNSFSEQYATK